LEFYLQQGDELGRRDYDLKMTVKNELRMLAHENHSNQSLGSYSNNFMLQGIGQQHGYFSILLALDE